MEPEVELNKDFYKTFFEVSQEPMFITTADGKWMDCNQSAIELFGFIDKAELMKTKVSDIYSDSNDRALFLKQMDKEGFVRDHAVNLRKRDGDTFDVLITCSLFKDGSDDTRYYVGIIRDITKRKREEEENRKNMEELKQLNNLMMGREVRIVELKKEIEKLQEESEKYRSNKK